MMISCDVQREKTWSLNCPSKLKVKITRISQGLVTAMVDTQTSTIHVNDRLMTNLPVINQINPISGGIQLAAAIVSGSPFNRLASNERNFIYINRGARDGMKIGRMFEAVESVKLTTDSVANPEVSLGEAMIVYVSDSYSTAIITKQFEVIRIGALLKTKQELNAQLLPKKSFAARQEAPQNIQRETEVPDPNAGVKELPPQALQNQERIETAPLSELDQIEKSSKAKALSAGEKNTLDKLVTQEAKKKENAEPVDLGNGAAVPTTLEDNKADAANLTPDLPQEQNSFANPAEKPIAKKDPKKKKKTKKSNDEEELNQLMMQNWFRTLAARFVFVFNT